MNKTLHIAFLATAMLATGAMAAPARAPAPAPAPAAPAPAPAQQFLGNDVGTFSFSGADDAVFYVTLDPGKYVITGAVNATAGGQGYNVTSATLENSFVNDAFEKPSRNHFSEDPYTYTVTSRTNLLLDVETNYNRNNNVGSYSGTLTIAGAPLAAVVPEPGTSALILAGLGLLGFSAYRRRV